MTGLERLRWLLKDNHRQYDETAMRILGDEEELQAFLESLDSIRDEDSAAMGLAREHESAVGMGIFLLGVMVGMSMAGKPFAGDDA